MPKSIVVIIAAVLVALTLGACSRLSPEAKKITGRYFIPEVSEEEPLMDLRKDGRCTITKIVPGVLTFSVEGRWNVRNDSLVARLDPKDVKVDGDTTLIGEIPDALAFKISDATETSLTIERNGIDYTYRRRP